jgi:aminoglycoside phosphotransferase (APT) family kinase protein
MRASLAPGLHVGRHLNAALEWLGSLHEATRSNNRWDLDGESTSLVAQLQGDESVDLVRHHIARLKEWWNPRVSPLAWSHGDFWARNVLLNGHDGAVGVVDWEYFNAGGATFYDVFHFAATYGLNYRWGAGVSREQAFRRTFVEHNHVSRNVRRYLARYCLRAGISPSLLPSLLSLYIAWQCSRSSATSDIERPEDPQTWLHCLRLLRPEQPLAFSG